MKAMNSQGQQLINELLTHPSQFRDSSKSMVLLQQFFEGFPIEHLKNLFRERDADVLRVAFFLASEFHNEASEFLEEAIAFHNCPVRSIRYAAIEIIARASARGRPEDYYYVLEHLEDEDRSVVGCATLLFTKANTSQLQGALKSFKSLDVNSAPIHVSCLKSSLSLSERENSRIRELIQSNNRLKNLYGVGIGIRNIRRVPDIGVDFEAIKDPIVSHVAQRILKLQMIYDQKK